MTRLTWGDSPMADQAPVEWREKILHTTLAVSGTEISGGDVLPGQYERPQGFQVQLNLDDAAAAERIFTLLADGGRITVPRQQTFWAQRFGAVTLNYEIHGNTSLTCMCICFRATGEIRSKMDRLIRD